MDYNYVFVPYPPIIGYPVIEILTCNFASENTELDTRVPVAISQMVPLTFPIVSLNKERKAGKAGQTDSSRIANY